MPWMLYVPVEEPQFPVNGKLGGPESWAGLFGEDKTLCGLCH